MEIFNPFIDPISLGDWIKERIENLHSFPPLFTVKNGTQPVSATSPSLFVIPALAFQTGASSNDFYAVIYGTTSSPINISVNLIPETVKTYSSELLYFTVPSSSDVQLFRIPYHEDLLVVTLEVTSSSLSNTTDLVLFGAGGLQTVEVNYQTLITGVFLAPLNNYFYASNYTYDYYLLVMPNAGLMRIVITPQLVQHLCNPVLLCNGHGSCDPSRLSENCNCISGLGYGFTGEYCTERTNQYAWIWGVVCVIVVVCFALSKAASFLTSKWEKKVCVMIC